MVLLASRQSSSEEYATLRIHADGFHRDHGHATLLQPVAQDEQILGEGRERKHRTRGRVGRNDDLISRAPRSIPAACGCRVGRTGGDGDFRGLLTMPSSLKSVGYITVERFGRAAQRGAFHVLLRPSWHPGSSLRFSRTFPTRKDFAPSCPRQAGSFVVRLKRNNHHKQKDEP